MVSSSLSKEVTNFLFLQSAKAKFPIFKRFLITLAKQHSLFRLFTNEVEIPVADEDKSVKKIQAIGFSDDDIRKYFLA